MFKWEMFSLDFSTKILTHISLQVLWLPPPSLLSVHFPIFFLHAKGDCLRTPISGVSLILWQESQQVGFGLTRYISVYRLEAASNPSKALFPARTHFPLLPFISAEFWLLLHPSGGFRSPESGGPQSQEDPWPSSPPATTVRFPPSHPGHVSHYY